MAFVRITWTVKNGHAYMCWDHSKLDRFVRFGQTEEYSQSCWDVWHAFIQGWAIHTHLSCVSPCMSLHGTQHGTQHGAPTPFNTRWYTKPSGNQQNYATELHTMYVGPLKAMGTVYQTQSQGYENTGYQAYSQCYGKLLLLVIQTPGWGSQTASIYPTLHEKHLYLL